MILLIIPVIYMAFELLRKMIKEVKIAIPALTLLIIPVLNSFKIGTKTLIVIAVKIALPALTLLIIPVLNILKLNTKLLIVVAVRSISIPIYV